MSFAEKSLTFEKFQSCRYRNTFTLLLLPSFRFCHKVPLVKRTPVIIQVDKFQMSAKSTLFTYQMSFFTNSYLISFVNSCFVSVWVKFPSMSIAFSHVQNPNNISENVFRIFSEYFRKRGKGTKIRLSSIFSLQPFSLSISRKNKTSQRTQKHQTHQCTQIGTKKFHPPAETLKMQKNLHRKPASARSGTSVPNLNIPLLFLVAPCC